MKLKRMTNIMCCSLALLVFTGGHVVKAENQNVESESDVTFTPNGDIINPVNPDEGGEIDPVHPPTKGPLSINYASDIAFGKQDVTSKSETFYALKDTVTNVASKEKQDVANFVQVTDLRGSASGWVLGVRQNGPFRNEEGTILNGAELVLSARSIKSMDDIDKVPTGLVENLTLKDSGDTQEVVRAEKGTGIGMWSIMLGEPSDVTKGVQLTVPAKEQKKAGKYKTSLTWFLQDAF